MRRIRSTASPQLGTQLDDRPYLLKLALGSHYADPNEAHVDQLALFFDLHH